MNTPMEYEYSNECIKENLNLFEEPLTQKEIISNRWVEYIPQQSISRDGLINFSINSSGDEFIDMKSSYIIMSIKISKYGDIDIETNDKYVPVNNFLHSIISKVDVTYNNTLVATDHMNYHYRAYLQTLLNFNRDTHNTLLSSCLWYKDSVGGFETVSKNGNPSGWKRFERIKPILKRGYVNVGGRLFIDLFSQNQLIPNGVNIGVNLTLQDVNYPFISIRDMEFEIRNVSLFARKITLSNVIQSQIENDWITKPMVYPFVRSKVQSFPIVENHLHIHRDNLFTGQLPSKIIIGFVETSAFMKTDTAKNPFYFQPFNVNYLTIYKNDKMIPSKPFTPNFDNDDFIRSYFSIFDVTNKYYESESLDINIHEYKDGYTLWGFNLTSDSCGDNFFNEPETGNIKLEIKFKEALISSITVIVYADFHNKLLIENTREIIPKYIL